MQRFHQTNGQVKKSEYEIPAIVTFYLFPFCFL